MTTNKLKTAAISSLTLAVTFATLGAATTSTAFAQQTYAPPPPPPPGPFWAPQPYGPPPVAARPPPPSAIAPNGEYVAPMEQTTQPTYVPQSVALSGPRVLKDWQDGDPIPYGYHRETRTRKGAILGGALAFGIPYLYSGLIASAGSDLSSGNGSNKVADLYVPVLGPFLEMGQTDSATFRYMLFLDGAAQTVGAVLVLYGLYSPRPLLVRNDLAMVVTPMHLGRDGNGLGFVGRF